MSFKPFPTEEVDPTFRACSVESVDDSPMYRHWSDGLTLYIEKEGVCIQLNSAEVQALIRALPPTISGEYR